MKLSNEVMATRIEHTLLKQEAGENAVRKLCQEAVAFNFKAVCVHPCYVELCTQLLSETRVGVVTVIGFPLGANCSVTKAFEAREALRQGATEIDMVINIGALKDRRLVCVEQDIAAVVEVTKAFVGSKVKVIIETALLTEQEKMIACELAIKAGAQYIKTSTGFAGGGGTVEDVLLIAAVLKDRAKIKASGGVKTREQAEALLKAGAETIGTSNGVAIITENSGLA